jgi:hypothetical protein
LPVNFNYTPLLSPIIQHSSRHLVASLAAALYLLLLLLGVLVALRKQGQACHMDLALNPAEREKIDKSEQVRCGAQQQNAEEDLMIGSFVMCRRIEFRNWRRLIRKLYKC